MALFLLFRGKGNQLIPAGNVTKLRNVCSLNGPHQSSLHNTSRHLHCHQHSIKPFCHGATKNLYLPNNVFSRTYSLFKTGPTNTFLRNQRCDLLTQRKFHVTRLKNRGGGGGGGGGGIGSRFEVTDNVNVRQSDVKRLLSLAKPEKWRLAGEYATFSFNLQKIPKVLFRDLILMVINWPFLRLFKQLSYIYYSNFKSA